VFSFQSVKQKFSSFGVIYNWIKQSILELLYWKTNLSRHNLDVMYIKNNMFENIFNMVIDVKGKIMDDKKAKMDIFLFYHHKNMELIYDGILIVKPKDSFVLNKNA